MSTDPWQDASDAFSRLVVDTEYPYCGGAGEYYECHQAQERSQRLLDAVEGVLYVLAAEAFWPSSSKELADRLARSLAVDLSKPIDS